MSGLIVRAAPTLDGSEPIGVWVDVAWSVYLDAGIKIAKLQERTDSLIEMWDSLASKGDDGKPTPEEWGASEKAQRGQEALMSMFGGGAMGAAPAVGDEG